MAPDQRLADILDSAQRLHHNTWPLGQYTSGPVSAMSEEQVENSSVFEIWRDTTARYAFGPMGQQIGHAGFMAHQAHTPGGGLEFLVGVARVNFSPSEADLALVEWTVPASVPTPDPEYWHLEFHDDSVHKERIRALVRRLTEIGLLEQDPG